MRAARRALEREEPGHQAKLSSLRAAIDEGDASGVADDNVFTRVRQKLTCHQQPATSNQPPATSHQPARIATCSTFSSTPTP
jgi:hypothetical protein